jgi:autotransporter-associated beta strand protein
MNISVGYYLHVTYFFLLYYKNLINSKPLKIAVRSLTKAIFLFFLATLTIPATGFAADGAWNVDADGDWSAGANWAGGIIADGAGFTADFNSIDITGHRIVTLDSDRTIDSLIFGDTAPSNHNWNLAGTFTLTLHPSPVITVNDLGTGSATINTVIAGSNGFTKNGIGTLVLSGINTYTGTTTIDAGVLALEGGSAIHDSGAVVLSDIAGATLRLGANETIGSLAGGGTTGGNVNLQGFTLTTGGNDTDTSYGGIISGTGGLTKAGTGRMILSGASTYTGATAVNAGVLNIQNSTALGTTAGGVTVADGAALEMQGGIAVGAEALQISGTGISNTGALLNVSGDNSWAGIITLGSASRINSASGDLTLSNTITGLNHDLTIGGAGDTIISGIIDTGTGTLTKDGAGALTLSGANTYTGGTTLSVGTLNINNAAALGGAAGVFTITGGAIDNTSGGSITLSNNNAQAWDGDFTFTGNNALNLGTGAVTLGADRQVTISASELTVGGIIGDGGNAYSLTKAGAGTLTLSGNNTYTGLTTIIAGTLNLTGDNTVATGGVTVTSGTLNLGSATALGTGTLALNGGTIDNSSGGSLTLTTNNVQAWDGDFTFTGNNALNLGTGAVTLGADRQVTISASELTVGGIIGDGGNAYSLTKAGAGTLTLSGANTYTGLTTLSAGTLNLTGDNTAATGGVTLTSGTLNLGSATALGTGTLTLNGGTIDNSSGNSLTLTTNNAQTWGGDFAFTGNNALNLGTGAVTLGADRQVTTSASELTVGGIIGDGGNAYSLTKAGAGTLTLDGVNTYTGSTIVNAGTLNLNEDLTTSSLVFSGAGIVNLAADKNITNAITNTSGATIGTLNYLGNSTTGGNIGTSNVNEDLTAVNVMAGTLTLNHNIFAATTILNDAAVVDISSNNLTIGGALNMLGASKLMLDILDSTTSGSITVTGAAGIPSTVLVDLNITSGQYIPHGTTFLAIDGTGGVVTGGNTVTDNIPYVSFTTTGGEDLTLVASRSGTGFDSWAKTDNSKAAGRALEDAGSNNPSGDMLTVLNTMEALQTSEVEGALTQMTPQIDRGIIDAGNAALGQNVQAISNHLKYKRTGGSSGVSTGDEYGTVNDVWIKAFGTYTIQKDRKEVRGYRARIAGAAIGADVLSRGNKTAGLGLGYSNNKIESSRTSKTNTTVDNLQLSLYYGYDSELNYMPQDLVYLDLIGAFGWNTYDASRTISFSSINRTAKSSYDGQQYTMYAEAGYHAPINSTTDFIPFLSLQYTRLNVDGYTEKDAGALSLNVDSQAYNTLGLGVGMKLASKIRTEHFDMLRELRVRWLYDLIADEMETTSKFAGGGAAFATKGARPSRHTFDVGGSLGFITNKNFTVDFDYDYSMKEDYKSHDGSAVLKFGVLLP